MVAISRCAQFIEIAVVARHTGPRPRRLKQPVSQPPGHRRTGLIHSCDACSTVAGDSSGCRPSISDRAATARTANAARCRNMQPETGCDDGGDAWHVGGRCLSVNDVVEHVKHLGPCHQVKSRGSYGGLSKSSLPRGPRCCGSGASLLCTNNPRFRA